ncbi:MAG: DNA primase, partial [Patescibacteria group bacterium]
MSSTVEQIKERLSIVDVVSSYIKLERAGGNFKARCPFHNEKTPSFFVSPLRETFHCFGCNKGGDILTFVAEFEGLDFKGALKVLADRAGVELVSEDPRLKNEKDALYSILEKTTSFWEQNLSQKSDALSYLKKRGLKDETIKDFRIGFAGDSFTSLTSFLKKSGVKEDIMIKAGLAISSPKGLYDRFRSRIMFPINDSAGRVIAFSGRIFGKEDDKMGKYVNSPETMLYSKSKTLYGFDKAKTEIRKNNSTVLVEGQMDLIMSHQAGFKNTVAISGTALTEFHLNMISRLSSNLTIALDADPAGLSASKRSAEMALGAGLEVKIAEIPEGLDPADLILKNQSEWVERLSKAKHAIQFYIDRVISSGDDDRKIKMDISKTVLPLIARLGNKIEQAHFAKEVSRKIKISEEHVWEEVVKAGESLPPDAPDKETGEKTVVSENKISTRKDMFAKKLASIILWQEGLKDKSIDIEKWRGKLKELTGWEDGISGIIEQLSEDDKRELIFECEAYYESNKNIEKEFDDILRELGKELLKEDFTKAMEELRAAELSEDHAKASEILKKCQDISKKISSL